MVRRRTALLLGALLLAGGSMIAAPPGAGGEPGVFKRYRATPADAFVDTVGVAMHADYVDTAYGQHDLLGLLERLGVRHIRDEARAVSMEFFREFADRAGPRSGVSILVDTRIGDVTEQLRMIAALGRGVADQIESDNEPDCDGWSDGEVAELHDQARRMRAVMDSLPELRDVPLTTPSMCRTNRESYAAYGDDGVSERFNMHPYAAGRPPGQEIGEVIGFARAAAPDAVPVVTEGGYHNAVKTSGGHLPTSERAESAYLPQMYLEYQRHGIALTHTYELLDLRADPAREDDQRNFGLYRADGTLKPAGASLAALLHTLTDPGRPRPRARSVELAVSGGGEALRVQPYLRSDGAIEVALWRAEEIWDPVGRKDLPNKAVSVTVAVRAPTTGSYVRIDGSEDPERTALRRGTRFTVPVSAHPTILRLGGGPARAKAPSAAEPGPERADAPRAPSGASTRARSGPPAAQPRSADTAE